MSDSHLLSTLAATFRRELAEHRLNRFLHVHVALAAVIGLLPMFTPDAADRTAPAWVLQGVLYCLSLSALLLGLSAAQGDAEEFPLLFTQPVGRGAWLAGKVSALALVVGASAALLVLPSALATGMTVGLLGMAVASAGVCLVMSMFGLAIGLRVRDHVRGLLVALGVWFVLLFGADLALLAVSGAPWAQRVPTAWVLPLMFNPLDALRVSVVFGLEQTAPAAIGAGPLVRWWLDHGGLWLAVLLPAWMVVGFALSLAGARRQVDA